MQQITKELPNGIILFVEVPDDAEACGTIYRKLCYWHNNAKDYTRIELPQGKFELLGSSTELTEEQLKEVMPKVYTPNGAENLFESFTEDYFHKTALESFQTLKQSLGIDEAKRYVVLFKPNS